jgi:imidazoleglycerol-phosphate dehydratase
MLQSFATHSLIDVEVKAQGDLQHHIVEDVALTLGSALNKALGDRKGIRRFGYALVPMDDALALSAVDLVRRPYSSIQLKLERTMLEDTPKEDLEHLLPSLTTALEATVHVKILDGSNDHHKIEAAFKAFALALRDAIALDQRRSQQLPTSKGMM